MRQLPMAHARSLRIERMASSPCLGICILKSTFTDLLCVRRSDLPEQPAGVCRACSHACGIGATRLLARASRLPRRGDRKRASDTAERAFKVVQREKERGGAAVRAVMGMVGKAALADEGGDLLGREAAASPHRGSRLPAARRSTVETDGVSWDRPDLPISGAFCFPWT